MIDEFIKGYTKNYRSYKNKWNYEDGCILKGAWDLYGSTGEEGCKNFVLSYIDEFIDKDGNIKGYNPQNYHLDDINSGKVLFDLYGIIEDSRLTNAIESLYGQIRTQPRTKEGNFWHKDIYPNQVWLDGLYMVMPFYIKYEKRFNSCRNISDITNQFINVRSHMKDDKTGLYYHGYDESRQEAWTDKTTGVSPNFWGRAEGWFMMALVDVLEEMNGMAEELQEGLKNMFSEAIHALMKYQDPKTGMWYQVIDRGHDEGNYLETSATLMIAYSILKGCRLGLLEPGYKEYGVKAFNGTVEKYLMPAENKAVLAGICSVAGLGGKPYRDGSFEYYISEKIVSNDSKGVGVLMMAYSEIVRRFSLKRSSLF
jgi:unsaturated rhamnogalacturonyl hydrolase